ncbi:MULTISPECIES: TetR/AcrR family transcriptional regulator [unclassified Gordonia (in: high G+C Gram-positive bacteria)]|uniref:TetR/AcrR family transcriptional regulator n=1 Tax=unclassified Gordonia (in: high G+C Gram-positive bacteria) TaxID=2657482 RepID=UPI0009AE93FB|nr:MULTISPECIES: TetR/AcrR family transcriptional regulator [unclassified Gordonia (in: high G+C Gram-positive bacteria)]MDF3281119.1 TetR/AcrR family transcriptional regulator [Gordonia sp. N1V]OPX15002.1 hypothetical protein B1964_12185 [Gordonia sp. i37]
MTTPRQERKLARRSELLNIAAELIAERGFNSMRLDDLGAAVGISGPAVYRYFNSKDALLAELLIDISGRLLDQAQECLASWPDPVSTIVELVDMHVAFAVTEPALIRVQDRDLHSLPEATRREVRTRQRKYVDLWVSVLREVRTDLSREPATTVAQAIFGLINCTPHLSGRHSRTEIARTLRDAALRVALPVAALDDHAAYAAQRQTQRQ